MAAMQTAEQPVQKETARLGAKNRMGSASGAIQVLSPLQAHLAGNVLQDHIRSLPAAAVRNASQERFQKMKVPQNVTDALQEGMRATAKSAIIAQLGLRHPVATPHAANAQLDSLRQK